MDIECNSFTGTFPVTGKGMQAIPISSFLRMYIILHYDYIVKEIG